jgi:transcriptional regulator with GAF, ATPase, and Fis domain
MDAYPFLIPRRGKKQPAGPENACALAAVLDSKQMRENLISFPEGWSRTLVGDSPAMREVQEIIGLVGNRRSTVLVTGETGTGKELVARAIHQAGERRQRPMVTVNCSAIPEPLLEAELFGHTRGAFTGAVAQRVGSFEQAHRSTILLDEVGDLPLELQAKLLRVLQEREIQRLGSSETISLDCRVIAATNADLRQAVENGRFRRDLYYRLNVVPLPLPPLRERLSDIPALVEHFVERHCRLENLPVKRVAASAVDQFQAYDWPGNVRELEHAIERAVALSGDRRLLCASDFQLGWDEERRAEPLTATIEVPAGGMDFEQTINRIELSILDQALRRCRGNKARAAGLLRMKRTTLASKVKALGYCAG